MDIGKLVVSIEGDNSGLDKALKSSTTSVDQAIGQIVGAIGLGSVAFKGLELAAQGVKFNAMMESAEVGFGIMLGSVDEAKSKLAELKYLADHSPMTFSGVTAATTTLLQFGVAGDKVIPTVKMLGDVAGGNEERMKQLALAFAQVSAAGKLQGQDLLQMINAGYNPLLTISEQTGESMGELRERMSAGAITSEEVAEAFKKVTSEGGQFFGMLEAKAKTLEGSFTTLDDATETFLGRATEAFTGPILVGVQTLTGLLNVIPGELGTIVLTVGTVTAGVGALALGVAALAPAFAALGVTINIAFLPLLGVTAALAAIGGAIALVGKAWSDAQPKEERIKQLTGQFVEQGKTFREAQILARQLVDDQEKSAEITKTMGDNYRNVYSAQAKAAEEQKKADQAKIKSQDQINKQLKTWDDLNQAGIVNDKDWLTEKIKIRQKIVDSIQDEAIRTGTLSEQNRADIRVQQEAIANYNAKLAEMAAAQDAVKAKVEATTSSYWTLQDAQKIAQVTTIAISDETSKIPPYLAEATGKQYQLVDGMIVAKEAVTATTDQLLVMDIRYKAIQDALKPVMTGLDYSAQMMTSLGNAAEKFGNKSMATILSGLSQMTKSISTAVTATGKLIASGGSDIRAWVDLFTSGIDLVANAWDTFWGNETKADKEKEKRRKEERKAIEADYAKRNYTQIQALDAERKYQIDKALKRGADTVEIEKYYASERAKVDKTRLSGLAQAQADADAGVRAILIADAGMLQDITQQSLDTVYESLMVYTARFDEAYAEIGTGLADALVEGASEADFTQSIMDMLRKMAIDAALLAGGFADQFKAIGVSIAEALKDGIDSTEAASIKKATQDLYASAKTYTSEIDKLFEGLGITSTQAAQAQEELRAEYKKTGDSLLATMTNALGKGLSEADFTTSIMDTLRTMAIDAAVLAGGYADKFKAVGQTIAEALKDGFQSGEVDSIKSTISSLYSSASSDIASINSLFNVPGFADGTNYAPGGLARVNEKGGEIINLPSGSQVIPADKSAQMIAGANKTIQINVQSNAPLDPLQTARAVRETMESLAFQGVA